MGTKKRIHIIGTHGVPAKYGGFETLTDILCQYLGREFDLTVYCNARIYPKKNKKYHHANLVYLPLNASGFQGIFYDIISYINALVKSDIILYLSPVGSGFMVPLKFLRPGKKVIVNHGGLNEWEREKLNPLKQKWAKLNHKIASRYADINIVDNFIYKQSLKTNFNADSTVIKYGGDHVHQKSSNHKKLEGKYPFVKKKYAVSVSRAQTDNNLHLILQAFTKLKNLDLVLISNWKVSGYGKTLWEQYKNQPNIILLDAVYDQEELDFIRGNAHVYIHSHTRCGTAPSLVEAMSLNQAIISYDVPTNRETTHNKAMYFSDEKSLIHILNSLSDEILQMNKKSMHSIARNEFQWSKISSEYKELFTQ